MRKQADRKVPQKRMCLRSLRKKTEHGVGAFGSACVRTALVLSLAAGGLALPSAAFPVMAETAADASVISVDYNNLEQLVQNNQNLKNALDDYTGNKETYENMLKTLEDDFTPSDESKVTNLKDYIEGYEVGDVYTKKGMTDDSYVVYACFSYICQGVETKAPALTQFYVYKNSEGNWVINNGALQDSEISAYMEKQLSDSDVSALIKKVQNELDQAQQSDPSLEEFLNGLGEEAGVSTEAEDGTMLTASEECNVRAEASTDADILGVISAGDQVQKTGTDGEWVQIDYDGQTGYIRGDLLE